METDTALVRAYGIVVLDTVAHVGLHLSFVVDPSNPEREHSIGDTQPFDEVVAIKFGVFVIHLFDSR